MYILQNTGVSHICVIHMYILQDTGVSDTCVIQMYILQDTGVIHISTLVHAIHIKHHICLTDVTQLSILCIVDNFTYTNLSLPGFCVPYSIPLVTFKLISTVSIIVQMYCKC